MQLDPASYLRLHVPHSLGATAAGASFATSSGDILDVECFGEGIFRLRFGPNTRPDYGIVVAIATYTSYADTEALGLKIADAFVSARPSGGSK
jgi:hypothetical protein